MTFAQLNFKINKTNFIVIVLLQANFITVRLLSQVKYLKSLKSGKFYKSFKPINDQCSPSHRN